MKELSRIVILAMFLAALANAADPTKVIMVDGRIIMGKIVSYDEKTIVLMEDSLGELRIPRTKISKISPPLEGAKASKPITIFMKNGRSMTGKLLAETGTHVKIESEDGEVQIRKTSISKTDPPLESMMTEMKGKPNTEGKQAAPIAEVKIAANAHNNLSTEPVLHEPVAEKPAPLPGEIQERATPRATASTLAQVEDKERHKNNFSIALFGGFNKADAGDINKEIVSWNNAYGVDWNQIHWGSSFKGEFLFAISDTLSFGLGAERFSKTSVSEGYYQTGRYGDARKDYSTYYVISKYSEYQRSYVPQYSLTVIPLSVNMYLSFPLSKQIALNINGGGSYNIGKLKYKWGSYNYAYDYKKYFYRKSTKKLYKTENWRYEKQGEYSQSFDSTSIGFQGGIGLEAVITKYLSFVLNGQYRFVNLKKWNGNSLDKGTITQYLNNGQYSNDTYNIVNSGYLWHFQSEGYDFVNIGEPNPNYYYDIYLAEVPANGIALSAGFRIYLF